MNMGRFETRFISHTQRPHQKEIVPRGRSIDSELALIKGYVVDPEELADPGVLNLLNDLDRRARRVSP